MAERADGRRRFLCAGLPSTGKTTFLVALYHVVQSGEVKGSLRLEKGKMFESDREYIQGKRDKWLGYEAVGRNNSDVQGPFLLTLIDEDVGTRIHLDMPDLCGESFRVQVDERWIPNSLCEILSNTEGLILFIHPSNVVEPKSILEANVAVGQDDAIPDPAEGGDGANGEGRGLGANDEDREEGANDEEGDEDVVFPSSKSCTAAKLVELLQFSSAHIVRRPIRVAVVVSAMDVLEITAHRNDPAGYLRDKLSLVDQFLTSNPTVFEYRVFGVSAQGVDYANIRRVNEVAALGTAASRIRVVPEPPTGPHDITWVIRWLESSQKS